MTRCKIITAVERKRRWNAAEKYQIVQETYIPGANVSQIARKYDISPSLLFHWRRAMEAGGMQGVSSKEELVPKSQVRELERRICELERALGRKTLEAEILKEGYKIAQEKKLLLRQPLLDKENLESGQ